ncbi:MAG: Carboxy-terminal processing protease CtpA [Thermocaproicibacter melissae]|jgi:carboxyl-terminal processing protease|uniref:S41 family peptidase n=1 Tax=Thermocaproicibacter melissae TaxID=2966552 RepID=UPI003A0FFB82
MRKKFSLGAVVSVAALSAAVTVTLTYNFAMDSFNAKVADVNERQAMYTKLSEIDRKVRQDYVGQIDEKNLTDAICAGYLSGLGDSRSQYLSAKKYKQYRNYTDAKSIGVGIDTVQDTDGNMKVISVASGSPGEKAGIKKGDTIIQIDNKEVVRITYAEAVQELEGAAGTQVSFKILRSASGGSTSSSSNGVNVITVTVTRGEYTQHMVESSIINGNVGYLRIRRFSENTPDDFNSAVANLVNKGVCGLVIDLRGNAGGSMSAAASVLDTLLPAGTIVSVRDHSGKTTVEYTSKANEISLPFSVVVDSGTSGASELFAADIRDFNKGLLIGEKTAGVGTKETAVPLSDGSAMILATGEYLTSGGKTFDGAGVQPDIAKSLSAEDQEKFDSNNLPASSDPQIQTAVTGLQRQGAKVKQVPGTAPTSDVSEAAKD